MEEEKDKTNQPINTVNEPLVEYVASAQKRLAVFHSFEDAAEADYEFYRNLTPEQRMNIHYEISIRTYSGTQTDFNGRFSF